MKFRIDFKFLLITFKVIHGYAPDYLNKLRSVGAASKYNLKSNDELLLSPPKLKTLKTLGDLAFVSATPKLWSSLPNESRNAKSVEHFKKLVKTHIFRVPFL